jgi:phosphatidate cytidylyltransferase
MMPPGPNPAWRDLGVRLASAAILAPISLFVIWRGGLIWAAWLAVMFIVMGAEWVGLCRGRVRAAAGTSTQAGLLLAGLVYIGPAFFCLIALRDGPAGLRNLLFLAVVVWAGDIGAYLVGRLVGGPRLAPRISPGKTWSGAAGGTLAAVLAGAAAGYEHPFRAAALALLLSVIAQAGDLLESALKRFFGAKDSGWIIPGHGGLLDRLDGVLTAAPAAFLWAISVTPHAMLWSVAS